MANFLAQFQSIKTSSDHILIADQRLMANFLAQFQSIKTSSDHILIAVEDVSDLWPVVKEGFEGRLPFKKALLNNKTRNPVLVEQIPAEFVLTTDARLRSRFPQEQLLFWFREPYATIVLVTCEVFGIMLHLILSVFV